MYGVAGGTSDCARFIGQFESILTVCDSSVAHREESPALQRRVITDVMNIMNVLRESDNPFLKTYHELIAFETHDVMKQELAKSLSNVGEVGISNT